MEAVSLARRGFLRGRLKSAPVPLRPPWALEETAFQQSCTRCNECVTACPTQIVVAADGGFPVIDFRRGECTFCGDCVSACKDGALVRAENQAPWHLQIQISEGCLAKKQVVCRSCADVCEPNALRFRPRLGGVAIPELDTTLCTGCGACINACPAEAINAEPANEGGIQA